MLFFDLDPLFSLSPRLALLSLLSSLYYADSLYLLSCADFIAKPSRRVVRSKVRRSQHFPRLDASNECQYVTRSVMRQISRNLVVFMSASPCTSNYETGSYVVRVKVMEITFLFLPSSGFILANLLQRIGMHRLK